LNNQIEITYNPRTKKLNAKCGFHLGDAVRGFPSRRFDPKSKLWSIPLVKANILHLEEIKHLYDFTFSEDAIKAIKNHEALMAAPKIVPFPLHAYDFLKSKVKYAPLDHQFKMLDLAWGLKACAWFAKMGTGKTYASIHLACARFSAGLIDAVLVICPSTLKATWRKEFEKFATVDYEFKSHDPKASWLRVFYATKPDGKTMLVMVASIEGFGVSEALYESVCGYMVGRRVMVILDESSRIKNPDAKRTDRAITLGLSAEYKVILNGTPIALGIQDLWSQYEFLDPNIIGCGDYWAFKTRYIEYGGYEQKQVVGYKNVEELMNAIRPYTIEVGKEVLNLRDKVRKTIYVEATPEQRKLFKLIIKGSVGDPNEPLIKVDNTLERRLRLRQVAGGYLPRGIPTKKVIDGMECEVIDTVVEPLKSNPKLEALMTMIDGHRIGSKFIIWTPFVHEIEEIASILRKTYGQESAECYYGSTDIEKRSQIEDRYCKDPSLQFFIANPAAAGLGLTLISGMNDIMVYYSGTDAYIDRAQSEDRSHRIGQENEVLVVDLVMERTIDEVILEATENKMNIEEYVVSCLRNGVDLDSKMMG